MLRSILLILLLFKSLWLFAATPTVTDVTAKQRFPWNGLVDIKCKVSGIEDWNMYKFCIDAVMLDSGVTNKLSQLWVIQNGVKLSDLEVNTAGDYHLIWDAKAELGSVYCTNMIVSVTLKKGKGKIQLWEGGPYWATTNIGAERPWERGYHFWWGDTVGYIYKYEVHLGETRNEKWVASDGSNLDFYFGSQIPTNYKSISQLYSDGWIKEGVLAPSHDAAKVHWGDGWRMPTCSEFETLISNCDITDIHTNGYYGVLVRGRGAYASKTIILPKGGLGSGRANSESTLGGFYWSSTPINHYENCYSWYFRVYDCNPAIVDAYYRERSKGMNIRPIQDDIK